MSCAPYLDFRPLLFARDMFQVVLYWEECCVLMVQIVKASVSNWQASKNRTIMGAVSLKSLTCGREALIRKTKFILVLIDSSFVNPV